jgi:hypothetical protein
MRKTTLMLLWTLTSVFSKLRTKKPVHVKGTCTSTVFLVLLLKEDVFKLVQAKVQVDGRHVSQRPDDFRLSHRVVMPAKVLSVKHGIPGKKSINKFARLIQSQLIYLLSVFPCNTTLSVTDRSNQELAPYT